MIVYYPMAIFFMLNIDYTANLAENIYTRFPGEVIVEKLRGTYLTRRRCRVEEDGTVVEKTYLVRR